MKTYGGSGGIVPPFLTSALDGSERSASRTGRFTSGERALATHWIRDWVGPGTRLDNVEKRQFLTLPGLELRPPGRPARSQSLYRLSYPGFLLYLVVGYSSSELHVPVCLKQLFYATCICTRWTFSVVFFPILAVAQGRNVEGQFRLCWRNLP
jgi:hypothetical protein